MQNGALTKTFYDANGNVIKTQTKSNVQGETDKYDTVEYAYDVFNRLSSSKQYANDTTPVYTNYWRSYPETEMVVTYGDDNNSVWDLGTDTAQIDYSMDVYGNVTAMTTHDIMESYQYDYQGRMITQNQGKTGPYDTKRTDYTYDVFDNILTKTATLPNGNSQSISYTYNQLGLRTSMTDSTGTTTYAYTPFGELMSESKGTTVKNYAYDTMSNRTLFTLTTDGTQNLNTSYTYDALNRLASVTQSNNTVSYTYDNNSNILQTVKADGSIENYTYNNANQLTQKVRTLNGTEKESYAYTYYLNGNIRTQNETLPATVNHTYTYDGMGRLTNETVSGSYTRNDTYTYDKRGNRTSLVSLDGTTSYTYNKNNQILEKRKTTSAGTEFNNYAYDDYGNRTQTAHTYVDGYCELQLYEYDVFNRLTFDNWFGSYTYDGDNIRQTITDFAGNITSDIYDGGNLVARKQGTNTHAYIYGLEQEFYISGNNFGIYSTNHRGDISKEIPSTGSEKTRAYSAYGTSIASAYSNISPFGYAGEVTDNTGLVYLRNRYYDPDTGTFMTLDPIKDGMNWYAYCEGNPVMYVDPWGLYEEFVNLGGKSDNVEVGLRDMVYYHGGTEKNIIVHDDKVIVTLNGREATYYYEPTSDNRIHGNRMDGDSMIVNAVSFGQHFGLTESKRDYGTSSVRFMSNLGEGIIGATINYSYSYSVSYVDTPNGIVLFKQEAEFSMWGWNGQPGEDLASRPSSTLIRPIYSGGKSVREAFLSKTCTHDGHIMHVGETISCYISNASIMLPKGTTKGEVKFILTHGASNMATIGSPFIMASIEF